MEFDVQSLIRVVKRWCWLVVLLTVVFGLAAFALGSRQETRYAATAQVLVNPVESAGSPDINEIQASRAQAQTFRVLATSAPVLDRTIEELGLSYDRDELSENVTATVVPETQIIEIQAEDSSAEGASEIANSIGNQFVAYVGTLKATRLEEQRVKLVEEAAALQTTRNELDQQIAELDSDEVDGAPSPELAQLQEERARADETLADLDSSIRSLNRDIATSTSPVEMSNPAVIPDEPFAPRIVFLTALGAFFGFVLSFVAIGAKLLLDTVVRTDTSIPGLTGGQVLAWIGEGREAEAKAAGLFAAGGNGGQPGEAIRLLRARLDIAGQAAPLRTVVVSAPDAGVGTSTVTANLGVAMAQAGRETVIVDANLRDPNQHELLENSGAEGVTTFLTRSGSGWIDLAQPTRVDGLRLIASGPAITSPADALGSKRFAKLLDTVASDVDVVLVDTPPMLAYGDALEAASHADGVVLVMRPGVTKRDRLRAAADMVHGAGIHLLGSVGNRVRKVPVGAGGEARSQTQDRVEAIAAQRDPALESSNRGTRL